MQKTTRELCERRAWGLELRSCPTSGVIIGLLREQNVQARNCSSEKVLGKSFLPRFIYIYKTLEQNVCLHIGLRYPDMYNLPIFSDYVKFLRSASLNTQNTKALVIDILMTFFFL